MEKYSKVKLIGEGTSARVFKAVVQSTGEFVAIKRIRLGKAMDGISHSALREIKLLQELKHPNIIALRDVFEHHQNIHLVFDFMETDLELLIRNRQVVLSAADIKSFMQMTLKGVAFLHTNWILHRVFSVVAACDNVCCLGSEAQ